MNTEKILLGSCMKDPKLINLAVQSGLSHSAFTTADRKDIWSALLTAQMEGLEIDATTLFVQMGKECPMAEILDCEAMTPTSMNGKKAMKQVLEASILRQVEPALNDVLSKVQDSVDYDTIKSDVENLQGMMRPTEHKAESMTSVLDSCKVFIDEKVSSNAKEDNLIYTGLTKFDQVATGIAPHEYVVIGARTSTGKSSFMNQMAAYNLGVGKRVAILTLETSSRAVVLQMAAQAAEVNLRYLDEEFPHKVKELKAKVESLRDKPLVVFDRDLTLTQITARARLLAADFKPDVVFIDYMGLVNTEGKGQYEKMTALSKAMIPICKSLGCALIVAAQLNRGNEREGRAPGRTDFRDSGSIEEDAHRIIALHRPMKRLDGSEQDINDVEFDTELLQLKLRDGPLGKSICRFKAKITKFVEL